MEPLNQTVFLWINAANPGAFGLWAGFVLAKVLVFVFPLYVAASWLQANTAGRDALVQGMVTAVMALVISWLIGLVWFHPRPFMLGIGVQHLAHDATASFPSNHLSFIWALCVGMGLHAVRRRSAWILALLGLPVAWARIYMGVHWPLDMLGAAINALLAALLCLPLRAQVVPWLRRQLEAPYRVVFAWPIRRGWLHH